MTRPTPPHLRLISGVHRERARVAPRVPAECPEPPTWLSAAALEEWNRLGPQLAAAGLLTLLDAVAFGMLCTAYADVIEAQRDVERFGRLIRDRGVARVSPVLRILRAAREHYLAMLKE